MTPPDSNKPSRDGKGLRHHLLIIEVLIFLLPSFVLLYIFYVNNYLVSIAQMAIFALTLLLILAGFMVLRQIFDKFFILATTIMTASGDGEPAKSSQIDPSSLPEIITSFYNLMQKFKETNSELKQRVFELFSIKELTEIASKSLDIHHLLNSLLEKSLSVTQAPIGSVFMLESEKRSLQKVSLKGLTSGSDRDSFIHINRTLLQRVLSDKQPLLVEDLATEPKLAGSDHPDCQLSSFLCLPVFVRGELIAALSLAHKAKSKTFGANDKSILSIMVADISFALENAQLHSKLQQNLKKLKERTSRLTRANTKLQQEIKKRNQAEEALRGNEEKYQTILQNLQYGYYEVNIEGNFIFINESMCEILGHSQDELMGENIGNYITAQSAEEILNVFDQIYRTGNSHKECVFEIIKQGRSKRFIETSIFLMRDSEEQPIGFRGVVHDITERMLMKKQKNELEARLQLAKKLEALGTLAGGIAHNFNNLLMSIQGNASLARANLDPNDLIYNKMINIEKLVKNGSKLTSQLLGYAREGKYEINPVNLNRLVEEVSETFGLTRKEIRIHKEFSDDPLVIIGDQGQVEQVLMNLYVNAADAMPLGGDLYVKTMRVTHEDMVNKPYKTNAGDYVLLTVQDTGSGMDQETQERIFEPFFTTKGLGKGTGLGLASAYGIIKGHSGYIDVDSEIGQGATFSIYLPASDETDQKPVEAVEKQTNGNETILLIEDEEMVLEVSSMFLKNLGYTVIEAKAGNEAIELFKTNKDIIDATVLDLILPDMGGEEVYDRLKEIDPDVKVILSSGYSIEGRATELLRRGCNGFIQKPFNMNELSEKVREILVES